MESTSSSPPIESLPYDTLLEIFMLYLDGHHFDIVGMSARVPNPWVLSAVNRRWREIVTGSRELWTMLKLSFTDLIDPSDARAIAIANNSNQITSQTIGLFLERSQTAPLSIILGLQEGVVPRVAIDLVGATATRWRELEVWQVEGAWQIGDPPEPYTYVTDFDLPPIMPSLRRLVVHVEYQSYFDIEDFISEFALCPRLRDLTLDLNEERGSQRPQLLTCDPMNRKFPWSQLTKLKLRLEANMDDTILLELIHSCVNLESLSFDGCHNRQPAPSQEVVLSSLRTLELRAIGNASGTTSRLRCPAIENLVVDLSGSVMEGFKALSSVFKTSEHPLEFVSIKVGRAGYTFDGPDNSLTDDAIAAMHMFFDVLPSVKKLDLDYGNHILSEYLDAMANHPEDLKAPRMEHLVLRLLDDSLCSLCRSAEATHQILALVEKYLSAPGSALSVVDLIAGPKEQPALVASDHASHLIQELMRYNGSGKLKVTWQAGDWDKVT